MNNSSDISVILITASNMSIASDPIFGISDRIIDAQIAAVVWAHISHALLVHPAQRASLFNVHPQHWLYFTLKVYLQRCWDGREDVLQDLSECCVVPYETSSLQDVIPSAPNTHRIRCSVCLLLTPATLWAFCCMFSFRCFVNPTSWLPMKRWAITCKLLPLYPIQHWSSFKLQDANIIIIIIMEKTEAGLRGLCIRVIDVKSQILVT